MPPADDNRESRTLLCWGLVTLYFCQSDRFVRFGLFWVFFGLGELKNLQTSANEQRAGRDMFGREQSSATLSAEKDKMFLLEPILGTVSVILTKSLSALTKLQQFHQAAGVNDKITSAPQSETLEVSLSRTRLPLPSCFNFI